MRMLRHLCAGPARRRFPEASLRRIAAAIAAGESRHSGQLRFAVEARLGWNDLIAGRDARQAARGAFAQLGVWDTAGNNGVLLYLLLADHRIEIVADRGYTRRVGDERWQAVCDDIQRALATGAAEAAVLGGIAALNEIMAAAFPREAGAAAAGNELPDEPALL
ncbi:TPM domain-containing protein [Lysobacter sp. K5869]|uniref:TPM domain-containing protein n=1 Tax=Lysobacter sp. K5869 TaxID=2820808 RepID=UPI001C05FD32|nr:TPM domain-containing protein [Lysobacter sp. K5869]QWP79352.1 TPM domain-containing protein [Lysobacter sp. K5869]